MAGIDTYTVLNLHCDGTNGSTSFPDSSLSNHSVTAVGNTQVTTSIYKFATGSCYQDGSGDYLYTGASQDFNFETQDFTIDLWVRFSSTTGFRTLYYQYSPDNYVVFTKRDTQKLHFYAVSGGSVTCNYIMTNAWAGITTGVFYHLAVVRNGSNLAIYINGTAQTLTTTIAFSSVPMPYSSGNLIIGGDGSTEYFVGYIDEYRVSKGIARWTSNFSVPTSAYSYDTNLPDDGIDSYNKLNLHCDGINGSTSFLDSSLSNHNMSAGGDAQVNTSQKRFGTGSCYLDGNDYLSTGDSSDWNFGTGDFTLELWARFLSTSGIRTFFYQYAVNDYWYFRLESDGKLRILGRTSSSDICDYITTSAVPIVNNLWYHLAVVRNGTNIYIFLNGVSLALTVNTAVSTNSFPDSSGDLIIGKSGSADTDYFYGYMDEVRISKGIARWTSGFNLYTAEYYLIISASVQGNGKFHDVYSANIKGTGKYKIPQYHASDLNSKYENRVYRPSLNIFNRNWEITKIYKDSILSIDKKVYTHLFSELDNTKDINIYKDSQVNNQKGNSSFTYSQLNSLRNYKTLTSSQLNVLRNIYTWKYGKLNNDKGITGYKPSNLPILRNIRQYSMNDDTPILITSFNNFTSNKCDVYVDGIFKGSINIENGEDTLSGIALTDGEHQIEFRMYKWFWRESLSTKRYYIKVTGGELEPSITIPNVTDLNSYVINAVTTITWKSIWNNSFEEPNFDGFGIWFSLTTPVDINGVPSQTVAYNSGVDVYKYSYSQSISQYVAVAGYKDSERSASYEEIYLPVDSIAPEAPENQYLTEL